MQPLAELLTANFRQLEQVAESTRTLTGLATGFDRLNEFTGGLAPGELVVVAGVPSSGKTALVTSIGSYVGTRLRRPLLLVDTLSRPEQVARRLTAGEARIAIDRLEAGALGEEEWRKYGDALATLEDAPVHVLAGADASFARLLADAREIEDLALIVVDGLSMLIDSSRHLDEGRWDAAARVVHGLKRLGLELGIPVIVTVGVGKGPNARTDKRPMLDDLPETSALIYDAELVLTLYRDELYDEDSPDKGILEVVAVKHRDYATGVIELALLGHLAKVATIVNRYPETGATPI